MLDVWHHVIHIQDRLLSSDIYLRIAWKNDNPIDGDIVTEYEFPQRLDVSVILPEGVPQLMFLGKTVSLVTSIRQILLPELCISATIYLPVDIFGLYHENTVAGDKNAQFLRPNGFSPEKVLNISKMSGERVFHRTKRFLKKPSFYSIVTETFS